MVDDVSAVERVLVLTFPFCLLRKLSGEDVTLVIPRVAIKTLADDFINQRKLLFLLIMRKSCYF